MDNRKNTQDRISDTPKGNGRLRRLVPGFGKQGEPSALYLLLLTIGSIFLVEAIIMVAVSLLPPVSILSLVLFDAFLLIVVVFPFLYIFFFRPMRLNIAERKRAEEALISSNELLERMFSLTHVLIAYMDPEFNIIRVNRAFAESDDRPLDFFVGKNYFELFPDEDHQVIFQEVLEQGEPYVYFETVFGFVGHPDRGATYWDWSLTPVKDEEGKVLGLILSMLNVTERRRAQDELKRTQQDYESLVNSIDGIVWEADAQTLAYTFVSQQAERLLGYPLERWLKDPAFYYEHLHTDDRFSAMAFRATAPIEDRDQQYEYRMINAGGEQVWLNDLVTVISEEGVPLKLRGVTVDITKRKQAEEALHNEILERRRAQDALRRERDFAENLIQTAQMIVLVLDEEGRIIRYNPYMEEISGYQLEEVRGGDWFTIFLPKRERERIKDAFWSTTEGGQTLGDIFPIVTKDGREREIEWYDKILEDQDGNIIGVLATGQDVTERKQAEVQAEALASAATALKSLDLEEVLDRILEQTQRVIPYKAAMILMVEGSRLYLARHHGLEEMPEVYDSLDTGFLLEAFSILKQMETSLLVADAEDRPGWHNIPGFDWVRSYAAVPLPIGDVNIGYLCVFSEHSNFFSQEITARLQVFAAHAVVAIQNARLYQDLEHALQEEQAIRLQLVMAEKQTALGRMMASVSHELNNPIQTIKNCLYLTQQDTETDSPIQEYLEMALSETQRVSDLVTQLRDIYRPSKAAESGVIDLMVLIEEVRSLLVPHLQLQNVSWSQTSRVNSAFITGIADQLKQVFLNLGLNAIEAMEPAGGELQVRISSPGRGEQVYVEFEDGGPGIPEEHLDKLFEPFFTTKIAGTGLGLSICYDIVREHGGLIEVENNPDSGAVFTVRLPLVVPELKTPL
jgi:PAS domain S-box-containing protein